MAFKWGSKRVTTPAAKAAPAAPETFRWVHFLDTFRQAGLRVAILIDGNSIFCREYHSHPTLRTADGMPTGAFYGWARAMSDFIQIAQPTLAAVAWDGCDGERVPNFRKALFAGYKAGRKRDEVLEEQLNTPVRFAICDFLGIPQFGAGYRLPGEDGIAEADDIIATLAKRLKGVADVIAVISSDRDMLQLVDDGTEDVSVFTPESGMSIMKLWNAETVRAKYGVPPEGVRVYKALVGDKSDAIPGIMGFGEKKFEQVAAVLAERAPNKPFTLDLVYEHAGAYPGKIAAMLTEGLNDAALFHEVVKLRDDVLLPDDLDLNVRPPDWPSFFALCAELEFKSLLPGGTRPAQDIETDIPF